MHVSSEYKQACLGADVAKREAFCDVGFELHDRGRFERTAHVGRHSQDDGTDSGKADPNPA